MKAWMRRHLWVALTIAAVGALYWGAQDGQYHTVKSWAMTLCTSCIGLGR